MSRLPKKPKAETEKEISRLNVDIPAIKHKKFKIRAMERNEEMKKLVEKWIDLYLAGKL